MSMVAPHPSHTPPRALEIEDRADSVDERVILHGVSWADFETLLRIRGDGSVPKVTYLAGEVELMSPSKNHEGYKKRIARLVEVYAMERGLILEGFGAWTLKKKRKERGVEPDECYIVGDPAGRKKPDLAIEVIWTSGGLDKLEVYRGLRVGEVWMWRKGTIEVHVLGRHGYVRAERSAVLPDLDLKSLASYLDRPTQTEAVREYQTFLRSGKAKRKRSRS